MHQAELTARVLYPLSHRPGTKLRRTAAALGLAIYGGFREADNTD